MTPSRELDALVAAKVMGIETTIDIPFYSTDIAAAWEVVERLSLPNPDNILEGDDFPPLKINALIRVEDGRWMARFDRAAELESYYERSTYSSNKTYAIAPTAPHAICLAALKALGLFSELT